MILCRCRIDTATELTYYQNDGILHYVIRNMLGKRASKRWPFIFLPIYLFNRCPILAALVSR